MSVKYKLVQRKDMTKGAAEGAKLYYAQSYANGKCTMQTLCETIADRSTATAGDVNLVLDGLLFVMKQKLQEGQIVQLGDLGYFQATLGSSGVAEAKDFSADLIKRRRIVFRPGKLLKTIAGELKTERDKPAECDKQHVI